MLDYEIVVDEFEDIVNGCEYGRYGVYVLEDGSHWFCNLDVSAFSRDIEFRAANVDMQEALRVSLLDESELFIEREGLAASERRMEREYPSQESIDNMNMDYYGTRQKIIDEVMPGAFDCPFGDDFSL